MRWHLGKLISRRSESPSPEARVKAEAASTSAATNHSTPNTRPSASAVRVQLPQPEPGAAPGRTERTEADTESVPRVSAAARALAQRNRNATLQRQLAESRAHVAALTRIALVDYDVAEAVVYQMRGVLSGMMARIRRERELVEGVVEEAG